MLWYKYQHILPLHLLVLVFHRMSSNIPGSLIVNGDESPLLYLGENLLDWELYISVLLKVSK